MPVTVPDPVSEILVPVVLHAPPTVASLSAIDSPAHTTDEPLIPAGWGFTVTRAVAIQPTPAVNVIIAVPAIIPVTTPEETPTVAIYALPLDHEPGLLLSVVEFPAHIERVPVTGAGAGLIETVTVREQPVGIV